MKNKVFGIIYKHTNKINGKCYIGQTVQWEKPERRWRNAGSSTLGYNSCPVFKQALDKYSWSNFETEILAYVFSEKALIELEEYYINLFNSYAPAGYNTNIIYKGQTKHSEESKKLMSQRRSEYYETLEEPVIAHNRKEHKEINGVMHKHCNKCDTYHPLDMFGSNVGKWDGKSSWCLYCKKTNKKKYVRLTEDQKIPREVRNKNMSDSINKVYAERPELKQILSKKMSKPIIATCIKTGIEIEFESALKAKEAGFNNTNLGVAIKKNKVYKGHTWRFKA